MCPPAQRRAVIDVGTNSVKLLVADLTPEGITPIHETGLQTRLGRGFYLHHQLDPDAITATATAVQEFAESARSLGAAKPRAVATSATRDATNAQDLVRAIARTSGLDLEILTGQREAELAFAGAIATLNPNPPAVLVLDVGGGSTEFVLGIHNHPVYSHSHQLGTVRLFEWIRPHDPPNEDDARRAHDHVRRLMESQVLPDLAPALALAPTPPVLLSTGGTAALLACIHLQLQTPDRRLIETTHITRAGLESITHALWSKSLDERKQVPGVPSERADIVLMGALIHSQIMQTAGFETLRISTRGLRFALLAEP